MEVYKGLGLGLGFETENVRPLKTSLKLFILCVCCHVFAAGSSYYDRAITTFSPSGRLKQVEYANEAVRRGVLLTGLANGKDAVVLCAAVDGGRVCTCDKSDNMEKKEENATTDRVIVNRPPSLLVVKPEKIHIADDQAPIAAAFCGLGADSRRVLSTMREFCIRHKQINGEPASPGLLANRVGDMQHRCTMVGGMRPLGVSALVAGFEDDQSSLFMTEPNGATNKWKGVAIGSGGDKAVKWLESIEIDDLHSMDGDELVRTCTVAILRSAGDQTTCCKALILEKSGRKVCLRWVIGTLEEGTGEVILEPITTT